MAYGKKYIYMLYFYGHLPNVVTGDANFDMAKTSLTVGGFNQPSFALLLIEMPGSAEKGLTQYFYRCSQSLLCTENLTP